MVTCLRKHENFALTSNICSTTRGSCTRSPRSQVDDESTLLRWVAQHHRSAQRSEAAKLAGAVSWAAFHSTQSVAGPAETWQQGFLPLAGKGTPEVAEFSIAEFAAAIGKGTDAGRAYIGDALELAHRLPRIYASTQHDTLDV